MIQTEQRHVKRCSSSGIGSCFALPNTQAIAQCLVENEFFRPAHLRLPCPPSEWLNSQRLTEEELQFAVSLKWGNGYAIIGMLHLRDRACLCSAFFRGPERVVAQLQAGNVAESLVKRQRTNNCESVGPRGALELVRLDQMTPAERASWKETARVDAILLPCSRSLPSMRSGVRCWIAFIGEFACYCRDGRVIFLVIFQTHSTLRAGDTFRQLARIC